MRPIQLTMQAFGPYKNSVTIDFDALNQSGMYLISGDTGAGKTTIFDAMMFALYGETSGKERQAQMLRSQYADASVETRISFTFRYREKLYRIERKPQYTIQKQLKDGTLKEQKKLADAMLYYPDGSVLVGTKNVSEAVVSLTGLTYEQFSMIAMIPQGKFETFLLADTKTRNAIFRELFHTEFYKSFQERLKEDTKQMSTHLQVLRQEMNAYVNQMEVEEKDLRELLSIEEGYFASDFETRFKKYLKDEKSKEKKQKEELKQLDKSLQELVQTLTQLEQNQKWLKEKKEAEEALKNEEKEFEKAKHTIAKWEKEGRQEKLQEARITLRKLEEELPTYEKLASLKEEIETKQIEISDLKESFIDAQKKKKELEKQIKQLKKEINRQKGMEGTLTKLEKEKATVRAQILVLKDLKKRYVDYDSLQKNIEEKEETFKELLATSQKEHNLYQDYFDAYLMGQAGILASSLKEEEPCPVCGSIHHPRLAKVTKEVPSEEALHTQETKAKEMAKKAQMASGEVGALKKQESTMKKELNALLEKENLKTKKEVEKKYDQKIKEEETLLEQYA